MTELWAAIGTGLVAGILHVVSGPDHVAAVLPFAVDKPKRALRMGVFWGFGHGLGVLILGALFLLLREAAPVERISEVSEILVGVLLVGLGLWALRRSRLVVVHHHGHDHDHDHAQGHDHAHPHVHIADPTTEREDHAKVGKHAEHHHSTLGFGLVHGLAGAGHLVVASPLLAFGTGAAALYLSSYLVAGVATMSVVALLAARLVRRPTWIPNALRLTGVASIAIGLFWVTSFALA